MKNVKNFQKFDENVHYAWIIGNNVKLVGYKKEDKKYSPALYTISENDEMPPEKLGIFIKNNVK